MRMQIQADAGRQRTGRGDCNGQQSISQHGKGHYLIYENGKMTKTSPSAES